MVKLNDAIGYVDNKMSLGDSLILGGLKLFGVITPAGNALLLEIGDNLLLETGDNLLLES